MWRESFKIAAVVAAICLAAFLASFLIACTDNGYSGTVVEVRGRCWSVLGDAEEGKRIRYAVSREDGQRLGLKPGQHVTLHGRAADKQDCGKRTVKIEVE